MSCSIISTVMAGSRRREETGHEARLGGREAGRRLVEQEHARPPGQRQRDLELALLAVGEVLHDGIGDVPRARPTRAWRGRWAWRPWKTPTGRSMAKRVGSLRLDREQAVLQHRQVGEEVGDLKRAGEALRGASVGGSVSSRRARRA